MHHVLGVDLTADKAQGHGQLQLAAAGEGILDVLLLGSRIHCKDVDRPAALDIGIEGLARLGRRMWHVQPLGASSGAIALLIHGDVLHVPDQLVIEHGRLDNDRPGERLDDLLIATANIAVTVLYRQHIFIDGACWNWLGASGDCCPHCVFGVMPSS